MKTKTENGKASKKNYVFVIDPITADTGNETKFTNQWIVKLAHTRKQVSKYQYKVNSEEKAIQLAGKIALDQNAEIIRVSPRAN
ncbi:MAG: hypothetical protein ACOYMF_05225 [Bacteroidales bacterium]